MKTPGLDNPRPGVLLASSKYLSIARRLWRTDLIQEGDILKQFGGDEKCRARRAGGMTGFQEVDLQATRGPWEQLATDGADEHVLEILAQGGQLAGDDQMIGIQVVDLIGDGRAKEPGNTGDFEHD